MHNPILIIGGTRGTGELLARRLLQRQFAVRIMARNPARAAERLGSGFEIVHGDLTQPSTFGAALQAVSDVIVTAGVTQRPAPERLIKATEHDGMLALLDALRSAGFAGRLVYMNSIGVHRSSPAAWLLNRAKGNTLVWRSAVEAAIRRSGLSYTIIRAGILSDAPAGRSPLRITQGDQPLGFGTRVGRADVAELILRALHEPRAAKSTFEVIWSRTGTDWEEFVEQLTADQLAEQQAI